MNMLSVLKKAYTVLQALLFVFMAKAAKYTVVKIFGGLQRFADKVIRG